MFALWLTDVDDQRRVYAIKGVLEALRHLQAPEVNWKDALRAVRVAQDNGKCLLATHEDREHLLAAARKLREASEGATEGQIVEAGSNPSDPATPTVPSLPLNIVAAVEELADGLADHLHSPSGDYGEGYSDALHDLVDEVRAHFESEPFSAPQPPNPTRTPQIDAEAVSATAIALLAQAQGNPLVASSYAALLAGATGERDIYNAAIVKLTTVFPWLREMLHQNGIEV